MTKHVPPVPPASRNPKGHEGGDAPDLKDKGGLRDKGGKPGERNLEQQGRQGNIHENTRNQGHQQDR